MAAMPVIRARIKELVDTRGWDVPALAEQIGVATETARALYDGNPTEIDLATLGRLGQVFGVLPHDVIAAVDEKQPSVADAPPPRSI